MAHGEVRWLEWSPESFERARGSGKLVLLDLTASWCHWCHVMDRTTYSDPRIVKVIEENFVPVRVDIDMRPDISERYNRGGFPTTAFLSDEGESVWGATYIPPADMLRIMESVLRAKESGEIDRALDRVRQHYLDLSGAAAGKAPVQAGEIHDLFEDLFTAYDLEHGGFGVEPKFPHPDMVDLVLARHISMSDDELGDAAVNTIEQMAAGLYDSVEGGLFRYSVTREWKTPHYEKMLETNLGFLRNLLHAKLATGTDRFDSLARGTARYILRNLRDARSGGFYGSQDADEDYYMRDLEGRKGMSPPKVDKNMYAGWNGQAAKTLMCAGVVLSDQELASAGLGAWKMIRSQLWSDERHLVRHAEGQELFLLEDQVAVLEAAITVSALTGDEDALKAAESMIGGVESAFAHEEGAYGDVLCSPDAIGTLKDRRRPLVENSKLALAMMQFSALAHRPDLIEKARGILDSFARKEVDAHGIFGAAFVMAMTALGRGPIAVEVHCDNAEEGAFAEFCKAAMVAVDPGVVVRRVREAGLSGPFAVVCSPSGCSEKLLTPSAVRERILNEVRKER